MTASRIIHLSSGHENVGDGVSLSSAVVGSTFSGRFPCFLLRIFGIDGGWWWSGFQQTHGANLQLNQDRPSG
jgi:hypothetical protein